jgi:hypothetical protein
MLVCSVPLCPMLVQDDARTGRRCLERGILPTSNRGDDPIVNAGLAAI